MRRAFLDYITLLWSACVAHSLQNAACTSRAAKVSLVFGRQESGLQFSQTFSTARILRCCCLGCYFFFDITYACFNHPFLDILLDFNFNFSMEFLLGV